MAFPIAPPVDPMLAKLATALPEGDGWLFEPKWDGFRAIVFRDGARVYIQSRDLRPLDRYFPELEAPLRAGLPERAVVDGEIVIATADGLDFDLLQLRLHPGGLPGRQARRGDAVVFRGLRPSSPRATATCALGRRPSAARCWRRPWRGRRAPSTSRRAPATGGWPASGSIASRARASTA
jgi:hypothetical protein